jgi:hypothetical protein
MLPNPLIVPTTVVSDAGVDEVLLSLLHETSPVTTKVHKIALLIIDNFIKNLLPKWVISNYYIQAFTISRYTN